MNETRIEEGVDRRVWENGKTTYKACVPEWTDAGGKRHQASKSFATLKEARNWRREQLGLRARNAHAVFTFPIGRWAGQRVGPTQALDERFAQTIKSAEVRPVAIHDVRHTHATMLLRRLVPINVVSERLGHHDPGFTLRTYTHVMPKDGRIAADIAGMVARSVETGKAAEGATRVSGAAGAQSDGVDPRALADQLATLAAQLRDASADDVRRALADVVAIAGRLRQ